MMKRKLMIIASVAIVVSLIVTAAAFGYIGGKSQPKYNVVEIYILNWDLNTTNPGDAIDIQFRISIDTDNDSTFDLVRTSGIFHNTTVESVPYRVGAVIPETATRFQFKVEVFRAVTGTTVPMNYTRSGDVPISQGINQVNFSKIWNYDATGGTENDRSACRIGYVCYVETQG